MFSLVVRLGKRDILMYCLLYHDDDENDDEISIPLAAESKRRKRKIIFQPIFGGQFYLKSF